MKIFHQCMFLLTAGIFLVFLSGCASRKDPMEPYRDLGAPKGFQRDTYEDAMAEKENRKKKNSGGMFSNLFPDKKEDPKKTFRDVSRPMKMNNFNVFPWRSGESRSSKLYDSIREENNRREPIYW